VAQDGIGDGGGIHRVLTPLEPLLEVYDLRV
jgi:hypothetical protein